MKNTLITFLFLISMPSCSQNKELTHLEEIEQFQYKLNVHYADKKTSPLEKKDLKKFKHLSFFPTDKTYRVIADFERTPNEPIFEMQTSTERLPLYAQYGIATFTIGGKELTLRLYQNQKSKLDSEYEDSLFIPFNDLTNGNETYGAGRYIDVKIPKENTIVIDFNKAYNPYCAYNYKYSCPIPPKENNLDIEIKAGVLSFDEH
ncbi:MAG: DUF1684 domain-containing protein [Flavobacteriaceae bacterium]|nr:DUF1684 domain-containing protein [Flavobacteriaceae bacterium]